jgi:molybdopterin/thiamine biosynthesis adenylyltransferase
MMDFNRFERQMKLKEIGEVVQQKWWNSKVLVVGVGGLGSGIIQGLVGAGVGKITLMDGDRVALNNLHRQWLFHETDVGRLKVEVAAEWIKKHNGEIEVEMIDEFLTSENIENYLSGFDLWLDGTDDVQAKLLMDQWAVQLQTPWIFGAAEQWDGQVSVFNYQESNGRSFRYVDFFSLELNRSMVGSCELRGVFSSVVYIIAMEQVSEALKVLGNLSPNHVGKMFCWDGWESKAYSVSL